MRILITAGPTREYFDDVRYLSNGSTGRMGYALAQAALDAGHAVELVSGPVNLSPPPGAVLHGVETTAEMRAACEALFPRCDGVIGAAAVCDYTPRSRVSGKIGKTGQPLVLELVETSDILAGLGRQKGSRWSVGFALEPEGGLERALQKLQSKNCDVIALNGPSAIGSESNSIQLLDRSGGIAAKWSGSKIEVARQFIAWIEAHLARR